MLYHVYEETYDKVYDGNVFHNTYTTYISIERRDSYIERPDSYRHANVYHDAYTTYISIERHDSYVERHDSYRQHDRKATFTLNP